MVAIQNVLVCKHLGASRRYQVMSLRMICAFVRLGASLIDEFNRSSSVGSSAEVKRLTITCPKCHKPFESTESGKIKCVFCNWSMMVAHTGWLIKGHPSLIYCLKCNNEVAYNDIEPDVACTKCDTLYVKSGCSLVTTCTKCNGTGLTGLFKKVMCTKCDGMKKLGVKI